MRRRASIKNMVDLPFSLSIISSSHSKIYVCKQLHANQTEMPPSCSLRAHVSRCITADHMQVIAGTHPVFAPNSIELISIELRYKSSSFVIQRRNTQRFAIILKTFLSEYQYQNGSKHEYLCDFRQQCYKCCGNRSSTLDALSDRA